MQVCESVAWMKSPGSMICSRAIGVADAGRDAVVGGEVLHAGLAAGTRAACRAAISIFGENGAIRGTPSA